MKLRLQTKIKHKNRNKLPYNSKAALFHHTGSLSLKTILRTSQTRIMHVVIIWRAQNAVRRGFGETPNATPSVDLKFNGGFAATADADSATQKTLQELRTRLNRMK